MSRVLIQHYLNDLATLRQVSGTHRESVVREAFKDLLKGWARSHELIFVPEYEIESPAKERRYVDGALLHALRMPFGYWEAKDDKNDLDAEIELKFKRGYPRDNIIFEDSTQAVLIQNAREVMRCPIDDVGELERLLGLFFGYQRPEIAEFRKAVSQFTSDLPDVLKALREMVDKAHADNPAFRKAALTFLDHARETINPNLVAEDVREILIQHILTDEIFDQVFPGQPFHKDNNVARELHKLEDTFFTGNTKFQLLKSLEIYYRAIRSGASQIGGHHEKQTFLKLVYENFYKVYNSKAADRLGVVYTPNEIVRFMIESADWLCEQHFGQRADAVLRGDRRGTLREGGRTLWRGPVCRAARFGYPASDGRCGDRGDDADATGRQQFAFRAGVVEPVRLAGRLRNLLARCVLCGGTDPRSGADDRAATERHRLSRRSRARGVRSATDRPPPAAGGDVAAGHYAALSGA